MSEGRQIGEVILDLKNISLRFGGVKAYTGRRKATSFSAASTIAT